MTYIQKTNANKSVASKRKFLVVIILAFLLGFFSTSIYFSKFSQRLLNPTFTSGDIFSELIYFISLFAKDRARLTEQILILEQKLSDQKNLETDILSLKFENERLRRDLNMKPKGNFISGAVLARSPQLPQDTLMVNLGLNDGVKMNDLVFASDQVLLGVVSKISDETSIVLLNSSSLISLDGFVARTGELIKISGAGGNSMQAGVTLNFDIEIGDLVIYSYTSDNVVAVVGAIEEDKAGGSKKILLSLPTNSRQIKSVFISPSYDRLETIE